MASLLLISPVSEVFDQEDNLISPITAVVFLLVIHGMTVGKPIRIVLTLLTIVWLVISIATDGSGLFAGPSLVAPLIFIALLASVFLLLGQWMKRVVHINAEVLCAAICGYLLLGLFWTGLYAAVEKVRALSGYPDGFVSTISTKMTTSDWLYFSYTTLTTTGYGDIIPKGGEMRMLAITEAMVGLFYNTIVIARFVGLYGAKLQEQKADQQE
jgi:hypothetical protein